MTRFFHTIRPYILPLLVFLFMSQTWAGNVVPNQKQTEVSADNSSAKSISASKTSSSKTNTAQKVEPVVYTYWYGNGSVARRKYETELIALAFNLSEEKFGKASFEVSDLDMSLRRMMKNMKEGKHIHFMASPYLNKYIDEQAVIVLPHLLFNNLLGYRQLIVRQQDFETFTSIDSRDEFQHKIVGQVVGWGDIEVFKHNEINVLEAPRFSALFTMLEYNRFDYISLGISESKKTFETEGLANHDFKLLSNLVVFYPWPVHIMVSAKYPELAERLNYGMSKAIDNGSYLEHFNKYYATLLQEFNRPEVKLIKLETPLLTRQMKELPLILDKATLLP